jgi:outer membrane protein assembly factor BamB
MKRRVLLAAVSLAVIALGSTAAYVIHVRHLGRDIRGSSTVEFVPTEPKTPKHKEPGIEWAMYGHDPAHRRVATGVALTPPFRRAWTFHAQSLVEFPPAVAYGRLFFATNGGSVVAISAKTGKRAWRYDSGRCQAMSPAVDRQTVYVTFLNRPPCNSGRSNLGGELVALWAGSGQVRWLKKMEPSESSPLVAGGLVYVGDWGGRVSCFAASSGHLYWRFRADGKVKGGIALSGDRVYFGTYGSKVYALNAGNGKLIWEATAQPRLGHSGEFYSTAAVAYDRVYIGSTDGKVYSFGATTGQLRWSYSTGSYVYSSPAVWHKRVYIGSYSGVFYSFDAATGNVLWSFRAGGAISGSPTIIAGRVYFATLRQQTYALDALTGKLLWTFPDGKYSPVVADPKRVYLVGYARIYGLVEGRRLPGNRVPRRR